MRIVNEIRTVLKKTKKIKPKGEYNEKNRRETAADYSQTRTHNNIIKRFVYLSMLAIRRFFVWEMIRCINITKSTAIK